MADNERNDDYNPQFGQRGAEKAYWDMVRKRKSQPKPAGLQPQVSRFSREEIRRKTLSELVAKVDELQLNVDTALADVPQKRDLMLKLGYNIREMRDIDVGRLLRQEYAEGQNR